MSSPGRVGSLERRKRAEPGGDCVEVRRGHAAEVALRGHRLLERPAVARDAVRERALDVRVGPGADAGLRVRRDVGDYRRAPRTGENVATLAEAILVVRNAVRPSPV